MFSFHTFLDQNPYFLIEIFHKVQIIKNRLFCTPEKLQIHQISKFSFPQYFLSENIKSFFSFLEKFFSPDFDQFLIHLVFLSFLNVLNKVFDPHSGKAYALSFPYHVTFFKKKKHLKRKSFVPCKHYVVYFLFCVQSCTEPCSLKTSSYIDQSQSRPAPKSCAGCIYIPVPPIRYPRSLEST